MKKLKVKKDRKLILIALGLFIVVVILASFVTISFTGNATFFDRFARPSVKATSCDVDSLCETNAVSAMGMSGNGIAYVCVDSSGKLFRSLENCVVATCGDGIKDGSEVCDGSDFGGKSCETLGLGFIGGSLSCTPSCKFNTDYCMLLGIGSAASFCGNGEIEGLGWTPEEKCDGTNLGGETCITLGWVGGTLSCESDCTFNTRSCKRPTY